MKQDVYNNDTRKVSRGTSVLLGLNIYKVCTSLVYYFCYYSKNIFCCRSPVGACTIKLFMAVIYGFLY
jgi:hypothetical protein